MLRAQIENITRNTKHYIGTISEDQVKLHSQIPDPAYVEIVSGDNGFYMFRYDVSGVCLSDSWFETLEQAKDQAAFEYDIKPDSWVEIT